MKDGLVHTVWTLSQTAPSKAGISLGETYPNPIVIAPEWSRHMGKTVSFSGIKQYSYHIGGVVIEHSPCWCGGTASTSVQEVTG